MTAGGAAGLSEPELRRTFEEAQRQADTVFAQYQLSQLLALGGELPLMTARVIGELARASDAVAGAIWLAGPHGGDLRLAATEPDLLLGPGGPTVVSAGDGHLKLGFHAWTAGLVGYPQGQRTLRFLPITWAHGRPVVG